MLSGWPLFKIYNFRFIFHQRSGLNLPRSGLCNRRCTERDHVVTHTHTNAHTHTRIYAHMLEHSNWPPNKSIFIIPHSGYKTISQWLRLWCPWRCVASSAIRPRCVPIRMPPCVWATARWSATVSTVCPSTLTASTIRCRPSVSRRTPRRSRWVTQCSAIMCTTRKQRWLTSIFVSALPEVFAWKGEGRLEQAVAAREEGPVPCVVLSDLCRNQGTHRRLEAVPVRHFRCVRFGAADRDLHERRRWVGQSIFECIRVQRHHTKLIDIRSHPFQQCTRSVRIRSARRTRRPSWSVCWSWKSIRFMVCRPSGTTRTSDGSKWWELTPFERSSGASRSSKLPTHRKCVLLFVCVVRRRFGSGLYYRQE